MESIVYKGLLTEESLDKAGRKEKEQFGTADQRSFKVSLH